MSARVWLEFIVASGEQGIWADESENCWGMESLGLFVNF
jgi:hypothetical protein